MIKAQIGPRGVYLRWGHKQTQVTISSLPATSRTFPFRAHCPAGKTEGHVQILSGTETHVPISLLPVSHQGLSPC